MGFVQSTYRCALQLCSLAELPMFAGTNVERDFVEAPSQVSGLTVLDFLDDNSAHHALVAGLDA